ncbi:MAG TPA: HU family DNA-binding protein [Longimicrobiales bacterium]|nr:HU family DNA-binding protein [Longimicrobiales bacterium]
MTKDDFAAKLAKQADLPKTKAREVIDAIFGTDPGTGIIAIELDAGRDFTVTGFGTFGTRRRKAREGRNPQTGESIHIPAMTVPTFRAGRGLKDRVRT